MIDHEDNLSDDQRAEVAWMQAARVASVKYVAPGYWPLAVAALLLGASWVLVFHAVAHLGGWWWSVVGGWVGGLLAFNIIGVVRTHRAQKARRATPIREQADRAREEWETYQRKRWWQRNGLASPQAWFDWFVGAVPRSVLAGYALNLWLPVASAVAGGVVIAVWPLISRALPNPRQAVAMNMIVTPKGPDGLPTPEV